MGICAVAHVDPRSFTVEELEALLEHGEEVESAMTRHLHGESSGDRLRNQTRVLEMYSKWLTPVTRVFAEYGK